MLQFLWKALKIFKGARDFFPAVRHVGRVTYLKLVELMSGEYTTLSSTDRPWPQYLKDLTTQTANVRVTPGGEGELSGERLKYDPTDPRQGLFLVPDGPDGTALRAEVRGTMSQTYVPLRFPAGLAPDTEYHVEMRTRFDSDTSERLRIEALPWTVSAPAA